MTPMTIDAEELVMAFENHDVLLRHFLDRESGQIVSRHAVYSDDDDREQLEIEPERYVLVEPLRSSVSYDILHDFIDTLPRGRTQADLTLALEERNPFRRFKDILLKYPSVQNDWFRFREQAVLALVQDWLAAHKVEAVVKHLTPDDLLAQLPRHESAK